MAQYNFGLRGFGRPFDGGAPTSGKCFSRSSDRQATVFIGSQRDAARHVRVRWAKDRDPVTELRREIYGALGHNSGAAQPHYYGHRQRLREPMIAAGPEGLPDFELLEMLLFAGYRRGDVNPSANGLLAQFGGFGEER